MMCIFHDWRLSGYRNYRRHRGWDYDSQPHHRLIFICARCGAQKTIERREHLSSEDFAELQKIYADAARRKKRGIKKLWAMLQGE